ncbi:hypothetical protein AB4Y86_13405 [Arthrobacter sp. 2YAF22_2]|jgi:hypothetical protein|uniref:hypothetical protein n=1 Tax=Arthrobacter sp. 2YAF22_2 TaxID=3233029 RepID=UPI003F93117E
MSQALVRIAALWLLGLMLAVAGAVVAVNLVNNSIASPQQPVREYLDALQKGDGAKALGLLRATVPQSNPAMLDGEALKTAAAKISGVKVGAAQDRGNNQVMVPVDYTLDGSQLHTEFLLQSSGTQWLFFHDWSFVPAALPVLDVTVVNSNQASLNGVPVNMPNGRNSFAVFYPGEYEASLNGQFFAAPATRTALSGRDMPTAPLNLLTQATDGLKGAVSAKVKEFLDNCADQADKAQQLQPGCPFYHTTNNRIVPGTIDWSITDYPAVSIEPFGGRWVVAPLDGKARIKARQEDLFTGAVTELNAVHDFSFTTRLDIDGDTIKLTPQLTG